MRKQFFTRIDSVLPRWVALLPYSLCLITLKCLFWGQGVEVWNRNSTRLGSFVMGVSDLDITIVYSDIHSTSFIHHTFKILKKVFIFLGEINFYRKSELHMILPKMNVYELERDPLLEQELTTLRIADDVEKFIFTQRMLFSDIFSLNAEPHMRQKKWKNHFKSIGIETQNSFIDVHFVIEKLKKLAGNDRPICESIDLWKNEIFKKNFDVYHARLGSGFRIMAPHCHLWFELSDEQDFLKSLSEKHKQIIQRQIEWEFWGLYTQRFSIDHASVVQHFKRLSLAYRLVTNQIQAERLEQEVALVFDV